MNTAAPRYIMIAVLLLLLANYPLLSAANKPVFIAGFPVLYLYVGCVWLLAIALLFITTRRAQNRRDE